MKNNNVQEYPIQVLRERLRQRAQTHVSALSRSVSRLTSCDSQPCLEYREEVAAEYGTIDQLLYIQQCRAALERCIAGSRSRLRYRWQDGRTTQTTFRRTSPGRIKVLGLEPVKQEGKQAKAA